MMAWTTVSSKEEGVRLIQALLELSLIACGQISGPIISCYKWQGKIKNDQEWRINLKFPRHKAREIKKHLKTNHPYEIPQWVEIECNTTNEYGKWVDEI